MWVASSLRLILASRYQVGGVANRSRVTEPEPDLQPDPEPEPDLQPDPEPEPDLQPDPEPDLQPDLRS